MHVQHRLYTIKNKKKSSQSKIPEEYYWVVKIYNKTSETINNSKKKP